MKLPETKTLTLDNGMKILLVEKHDVPLIAFHGRIRGGDVTDEPGKAGTAALAAELLTKGAGTRSATAFSAAVDSVGGNFDTRSDTEALIVRGEFMARDSGLMLELLSDALVRPAFDASELDKLRKRSIDRIASAKDNNPGNVIGAYFASALYGDHPYGRAASETSLPNISRDDVKTWFASQVGSDRAVFAFVGDFETKSMEKAVKAAFSDWKSAKKELEAAPAVTQSKGRRVLLVDKPDATQTYFRFGNVGVARAYPERVELDMVNTAFGGRFTSMLNSELRIRTGLTYGARSIRAEEAAGGSLSIYSFTKTESTKEAIDLALDVLSRLHEKGIDAETLSSIKAYVKGQYPPDLETGPQLAAKLTEIEMYGLGRGDVDDFEANVEKASTEELSSVIASVYPKDDLVFVLIGNADAIRETAKSFGDVTEMKITDKSWETRAAEGEGRK
jgi:predicted Zn-dependent peptidase